MTAIHQSNEVNAQKPPPYSEMISATSEHITKVFVSVMLCKYMMPVLCSRFESRQCAPGNGYFEKLDCFFLDVQKQTTCSIAETANKIGVIESTLLISLTGIAAVALILGAKEMASRLSPLLSRDSTEIENRLNVSHSEDNGLSSTDVQK